MKYLILPLLFLLASLLPSPGYSQDIELNKSSLLILRNHVASSHGYIGGEAHDRYKIDLKQGQNVRIKIASKGNAADFYLSASESFIGSEPVKFGHDDPNTRSWAGLIPSSQPYYIFVSAYPTAHYKLIATVR